MVSFHVPALHDFTEGKCFEARFVFGRKVGVEGACNGLHVDVNIGQFTLKICKEGETLEKLEFQYYFM